MCRLIKAFKYRSIEIIYLEEQKEKKNDDKWSIAEMHTSEYNTMKSSEKRMFKWTVVNAYEKHGYAYQR